MLSHFRHNAVAYLALAVALGTGTAYAADTLPRGSVTTAALRDDAVTSAKIKNGSVSRKDLRTPPYVRTTVVPDGAGAAASRAPFTFSAPSRGTTSLTVFLDTAGARCDFEGTPSAALVVDGTEVASVPVLPRAQARAAQVGGTVRLAKGQHTAQVVYDCFKADQAVDVVSSASQTWTVVQAGQGGGGKG